MKYLFKDVSINNILIFSMPFVQLIFLIREFADYFTFIGKFISIMLSESCFNTIIPLQLLFVCLHKYLYTILGP